MVLVEDIYRATAGFPGDERFGLTAQLRRASVSIPSNIGEGKRRGRDGVFVHHLAIALGSQGEVEVQLEIARRLGYLSEKDHAALARRAEEVGRMLNGHAVTPLLRLTTSTCGTGLRWSSPRLITTSPSKSRITTP